MLSVRFPRELADSVKYWARRDGVTVSEWLRRLAVAEMKTPNRQPPVDVTLYPQSITKPSGIAVDLEWTSL